jgi:hypothetical protein
VVVYWHPLATTSLCLVKAVALALMAVAVAAPAVTAAVGPSAAVAADFSAPEVTVWGLWVVPT